MTELGNLCVHCGGISIFDKPNNLTTILNTFWSQKSRAQWFCKTLKKCCFPPPFSAKGDEAREPKSFPGTVLWLGDLWHCYWALQQGKSGGFAGQRRSASWLDVQVFLVNGSDQGKKEFSLFYFTHDQVVSLHVYLFLFIIIREWSTCIIAASSMGGSNPVTVWWMGALCWRWQIMGLMKYWLHKA